MRVRQRAGIRSVAVGPVRTGAKALARRFFWRRYIVNTIAVGICISRVTVYSTR
ncbi:MAG: hypothetical protein IJD16_04905 [Desulfovibrio sp.]|nr:hypothetical protein [Desulfovibrio sp.]